MFPKRLRAWWRPPTVPYRVRTRNRTRPILEPLEGRVLLSTYVVNSVGDDPDGDVTDGIADTGYIDHMTGESHLTGLCTLRAAIMQADADGVAATIDFAIGAGLQTIVTTGLPAAIVPVTFDGTSQPGYDPAKPTPLIELVSGTGGSAGLALLAPGCTVQGFDIHGFGVGIVSGSPSNLIQGNYIGTDPTGKVGLPNGDGIDLIGAFGNTVGGLTPATQNVIAANTGVGVFLLGPATFGNVVEGNRIGTDITGTKPLGNGIGVALNAPFNTVGGTTPAARNLISANSMTGVTVFGDVAGLGGDVVEGNYIGTDVSGTLGLGNRIGVVVTGLAKLETIGGAAPSAGNLISGNIGDGVQLFHGATLNLVQGNLIGTTKSGFKALGNGGDGVAVFNSATSNTIGGTTPALRNLISANGGDGVFLSDAGTAMNVVEGNFIGVNAAASMALPNAGDGVALVSGAASNTIGGATLAAGNVISGNGSDGVFLSGAGTSSNVVDRNRVGTNGAGLKPLPNGSVGVEIASGASMNTIGGTGVGPRNIIAANGSDGVRLTDTGTTGNVVAGNYIGLNAAGAALGNAGDGVSFAGGAAGNLIDGTASRNIISGNTGDGVSLTDAGTTGNVLKGNRIGTNPDGTTAVPNAGDGVSVTGGAASNTVGGTTVGAGNLISGNGGDGVLFDNGGTSSNLVQGNTIGLDKTGGSALGNTEHGVDILNAASGNTIGGAAAGARNVISGNGGDGVFITDAGTTGNLVQANYIGTNAAGTKGVANVGDGVGIANGAAANTIGGAVAGLGNVISGNDGDGVFVTDAGTTGNLVDGNYVGTVADGTDSLGNSGDGIGIVNGATKNTIGGTVPEARNVIADNGGDGVFLSDAGTTKNLVEGNYIGLDVSGSRALGNAGDGAGIVNGAASNTIGGTMPGARNVISGNGDNGVRIADFGTTGNKVQGNFIGTNAAGTKALGNAHAGVDILHFANKNQIGGKAAGTRNVISGNRGDGVRIGDAGTLANNVQGNYIGTNAAGTRAIGNAGAGVAIVHSAGFTLVGGSGTGTRNVISGNFAGVVISDTATAHNRVEGNYIGLNAAGTKALGNTGDGVDITNGASHNSIGGTKAAQRNIISGNGGDGVYIADVGTTANRVLGNRIGTGVLGQKAIGNGLDGIALSSGAAKNTIGGTGGGRNLISGNGRDGVRLTDAGTTGNQVSGNLIGTNAIGTAVLGNAGDGVHIFNGAANNTIGGSRNVISGNGIDGVLLAGTGTTGNRITSNFIGTNAAGTAGLGNLGNGIAIGGGAAGNIVGGAKAKDGNLISGNAGDGILIAGAGTDSNRVHGNVIGLDKAGMVVIGNGGSGVDIGAGASHNQIGGSKAADRNVISGNLAYGVFLTDLGTTANRVLGNRIGTNAAGTAARGNALDGVAIVSGASKNTVGGPAAAGNIISGNGSDGVRIADAGATGNSVLGNRIGTNTAGSAALGNTGDGVAILEGASGNSVGSAGARNVISGNGADGVLLAGVGTTGNHIAGNYIGVNAAGTKALGNLSEGVALGDGAAGNVIGGLLAGTGNVISGNKGNGIFLTDSGTSANLVEGNRIGTDATGSKAVGNGSAGVRIAGGASGNTIGGSGAGAGNSIAHNHGAGVAVVGATTLHDRILRDALFSNGGLGIDLGDDGVTANDSGDTDSGPNDLQNFPVLSSAGLLGSTLSVHGTIDSTPRTTFRIELFSSPAPRSSRPGEGRTFLGFLTVHTNAAGKARFTASLSVSTGAIGYISATATNPGGDTSEFARAVKVKLPPTE